MLTLGSSKPHHYYKQRRCHPHRRHNQRRGYSTNRHHRHRSRQQSSTPKSVCNQHCVRRELLMSLALLSPPPPSSFCHFLPGQYPRHNHPHRRCINVIVTLTVSCAVNDITDAIICVIAIVLAIIVTDAGVVVIQTRAAIVRVASRPVG